MNNWQQIRYPLPLQPGDTIGITAPSSGVDSPLHPRLDVCIGHLKDLGYKVVEGACLRQDAKHVSGSREARAKDLLALWKSPEVKAIVPPWGGELLIHLLPHIDFEEMAHSQPKWILGYSDTSTLLFALTTLTGIATAHGTNLMDMAPDQAGDLSRRWQDVLATEQGGRVDLRSSSAYQVTGPRWEHEPLAKFNLTEPTRWRCMVKGREVESLRFQGRIIGGCLETLSPLVGTPYGDLPGLKGRLNPEGVVLFLESCGSSPATSCRMLWHMRLAGWFDNLAGLIIGRPSGEDAQKFSHLDALHDGFDDLDIPVIFGADIGHLPPQMTIVNGAVATVESSARTGRVEMELA